MKITKNFFELSGELDQKYFPDVIVHRDRHHSNVRAQKMHYAIELFNNGCSTYDKLIKTLAIKCKDTQENIHKIVSKYIEDFEEYEFKT